MDRALSEPRGNPFRSDRARRELHLQSLRPLNLPELSETPVRDEMLPPVPTELGEWSDGSDRNPLQDVSSNAQVQRGRQRSRGGSMRSEGDRGRLFRTPESWQRQVNEGLMPTSVESAGGPRQVSEGLMPAAALEGEMPGSTPEAGLRKQSLEQAMGEELVQHVLKENQELKTNLMDFRDMLSQRSSQQPSCGSWSNVSQLPEVAPKTPRAVGVNDKNEKRFTPGGTQVPSGTPPGNDSASSPVVPPPPLPPFPDLERYEKIGGGVGPCPREFGRAWVPVQQRAGNRNDWVMFPVQIGTVDTLDQISLGGLIGMLVWRLRNRIYDLTNVMTVGPLELLSMVYLVLPPVYVLTVGLVQAWCLGNIVNITVNVMTVGLQLARFSVEFLNLREYVINLREYMS